MFHDSSGIAEEDRRTKEYISQMKSDAIVSHKNIAIQEIGRDGLFKQMQEWSDGIARRAYELFANSGFTHGHDLEHWFKAEQELLQPLTIELQDTSNDFVLKAQVPGFDARDLEINLDGLFLTIQGKHEDSTNTYGDGSGNELKAQQIWTIIELPAAVNTEKAHAELKDGELELTLPKVDKTNALKMATAA
jgi:HSP20 family protein